MSRQVHMENSRAARQREASAKCYAWDLSDHLQSPKPRNPEKSQKSLPRGVWDPPTPDPQKLPKRVRKVKKIVDFDYFSDFSDFFWNFSGSGVGGSQTPFGRLFETFRGFRDFGLCRWRAKSQCYAKIWFAKISCALHEKFYSRLVFVAYGQLAWSFLLTVESFLLTVEIRFGLFLLMVENRFGALLLTVAPRPEIRFVFFCLRFPLSGNWVWSFWLTVPPP